MVGVLEALAAEDYNLDLTGFDEEELQELLQVERELCQSMKRPRWRPMLSHGSATFGSWGDHRLLCGDGTSSEDVSRVLDGKTCHLVFADLPYNVDYTGKSASKMKLANDDLGSDFGAFLLAACQCMLDVSVGPVYICMSSSELHHLYEAFVEAGGHWSTYIIWAKNTFTLGRSDYQRQYEPILYGWPEGKKHFWCGDRKQGVCLVHR